MQKTFPETDENRRLLRMLLAEGSENGWLELKHNNADPQAIGEYVSALANGAALAGAAFGYLVWGVRDGSREVVGTTFDPTAAKGKGNEDLEPWLVRLLEPQVSLRFLKVPVDSGIVWILEIGAARDRPVSFSGREYVRVGSTTKPLGKHAEHERRLWQSFSQEEFASGVAAVCATEAQVLDLLHHGSLFELLGATQVATRAEVIEHLVGYKLIRQEGSGWAILNRGAVLFARRLTDFDPLRYRRLRVIQYPGNSRGQDAIHEREFDIGYASGFEAMISYITARLPHSEVTGPVFRRETAMYPEIVLRELLANALIHQDFTMRGSTPMVEIFDGRVEFTNPGRPLLDVRRFVDLPARSRNEGLAEMMRIVHLAEARSSGWDKVAAAVEEAELPAPKVESLPDHTRVTLYSQRPLTRMESAERVRAVYLHACLRQINDLPTSNASVRDRFGIPASNAAQATRLIAEAVAAGMVAVANPADNPRQRRYLPFWAVER